MNQTKKRLQIIKLAISITDIETIQLQILKLTPLKTDKKIQEIIKGLQSENYAQTQALITTYIETPMEEILQRSSQEEEERKKEEQSIIDEFDLFVTTPQHQKEEKEVFDFNALETKHIPVKEKKDINFDALLNMDTKDIMSNNITLNIKDETKDDFFDEAIDYRKKTKKSHIDTAFIPKDTFFDSEEKPKHHHMQEIEKKIIKEEKKVIPISDDIKKTVPKEPINTSASEQGNSSQYKAIPYIEQKFKNMQTQYPLLYISDSYFSSVNKLLLKISHSGYSEQEIEETVKHIEKLNDDGEKEEASKLLLISGATESKFAQFILARELYKGQLLQKNIPEAFTLINRLAIDDDYPEAICDLGQFYENGIGIDKDKKKAERLYKSAMKLGIHRAIIHYERVKKQNRNLLSAFKK